jgi:hypothetical protein
LQAVLVVIYQKPWFLALKKAREKRVVMNEIAIKKLREMSLKQQLLFCESYLPDAWEFLHDISKIKKPEFDDNDEWIVKEDNHATGHD